MGSEATGTSGRSDEDAIDETQDLPPEMRRELERRRLSQEEKRVANAAAEYKQRLAQGDKRAAALSKASTIQNRVKNLLNDNNKNAPVNRTAEGYGKYTDVPKPAGKPPTWRKPVPISNMGPTAPEQNVADADRPRPFPGYMSSSAAASSPATTQAAQRTGPRPSPAPKPMALRTGGNSVEPAAGRTKQEQDDWETNFTKRYPSLSGIEMVETEIVKGPGPRGVRDV
jgi:AP2-associated kinase